MKRLSNTSRKIVSRIQLEMLIKPVGQNYQGDNLRFLSGRSPGCFIVVVGRRGPGVGISLPGVGITLTAVGITLPGIGVARGAGVQVGVPPVCVIQVTLQVGIPGPSVGVFSGSSGCSIGVPGIGISAVGIVWISLTWWWWWETVVGIIIRWRGWRLPVIPVRPVAIPVPGIGFIAAAGTRCSTASPPTASTVPAPDTKKGNVLHHGTNESICAPKNNPS